MQAQSHHHLFHDTLKERHRVLLQRLAELTACRRLPDCGGYEPAALDALVAWARQGVADAAMALHRMSEGTYGVCEACGCTIPLGHLRISPDAHQCVPCQRRIA